MAAMKAFVVLLSAVMLANQVQAASIFFPGEEAESNPVEPQLIFKQTPKCAKNSVFCSDSQSHVDYPTELVRKAIGNIEPATTDDIIRGDETVNQTGDLSLNKRFGGSVHDDINLVEETAACAASEAIIFPTMGMNTNHDWMYVANIKGVIVQGIRVEKCVEEGKPCKIGETGTICRQKYIYRKLMVLNANKSIGADNFRVPSACVCYIKNEFLLSTRGLFNTTRNNATKSSGGKRSSRSRPRSHSRSRRQTPTSEFEFSGGEAEGLSGSPLDNSLTGSGAAQGTAQQSVETEETLNPSDTIGQTAVRYAGEIIVESNPIVVQKKPPKSSRRRN